MNIINNYESKVNFKSYKVKFSSKYFKNNPKSKQMIVDIFEQNKSLKNFCNHFDTKIQFKTDILPLTKHQIYSFDDNDELNNFKTNIIVSYKNLINKNANIIEKIKHYLSPYKQIVLSCLSDGFEPTKIVDHILLNEKLFKNF